MLLALTLSMLAAPAWASFLVACVLHVLLVDENVVWKQLADCTEVIVQVILVTGIIHTRGGKCFWMPYTLEILSGFSFLTWSSSWWEIRQVSFLKPVC